VLKLNLLIILLFFAFSAFGKKNLCSSVVVHGDKLKFTETEQMLLCGDKKTDAYRTIPDYEASFLMTGFLQSRGYLEPHYETIQNVLHVHTGKKSVVKKLWVFSKNQKLKNEVKHELNRLFKKKLLSTDILNSIESEALALVRQRGYPCAKVKAVVDISRKLVIIELNESNFFKFGEVKKETLPGLRENALDRYYPFKANQTFNADLLRLTEKRMIRQDVVPATYFIESCEDNNEKFSLSQSFIQGPPHTIRFGAGISTEQGPMVRARWYNNRYKSMASQHSLNVQASLRAQSITVSSDSFIWHHEPRRSIFSQAEIIRESQVDYEQLTFRLEPAVKWTRDSVIFNKVYTLGPSYEAGTYHSKAESTQSFASTNLKGTLLWTQHKYELFDFHPQEGNLFGLNFDFRHPATGFSDPLFKLDSTLVRLDRLANWGRGTIIGGIRFNAGTTWVSDDVLVNDLPPTVKFFGGGSDDVRGFTLRTLPQNDGLGALTKVGAKFELRRTYLFYESLEAFTFMDAAWFGDKSWSIDPELFYSPGVGIRWLSPFGMVQSFLARGLKTNPYKDMGNLFYVGIGGIF
jgi:translocation and assembly module TamA